jgi:hypothetical protein
MTQYLLTIYQPDGAAPPPEVLDPIMQDVETVRRDMKSAGVWVFSGGLHAPSTATVQQVKGEEVLVSDGPYAEGKEYVGGLTIIDVPDLDAALAWGERLARALRLLPVEVRPFQGGSA